MAEYILKEVRSSGDLDEFVKFPMRLYKDCPYYVPPLISGQKKMLTKSASLMYCTNKMWLALDGNKVVGRICGILNPRYDEKYGTRRVSFGWFDFINDIEVAKLLIDAVEQWGSQAGMTEIHGPLSYNSLGRQGMLVEGYDKLSQFSCLYNYPYYVDIMEQLGFVKECDWVQYRMPASQGVDERMKNISERVMQRYNLREADFNALKNDRDMVRRFFKIYNESFDGIVYNFVPFTDEEIEEEIDEIVSQLDERLCCVLLDSDDDIAAFGITMPSVSKAMQKAGGRLFPFGWYHLLKAKNDMRDIDLLIQGASPKWQKTGISSVFHLIMSIKLKACGSQWAIANPQMETNTAVNVWDRYEHELWFRRRCFIRDIKM